MKLIIDIDNKIYGLLKYFEKGLGLDEKKDDDDVKTALMRAVINGTSLPDNPTNGAVICLLYPNLRYVIQDDRVITTIGTASSFDLDWWNAPYREDGEK